MYIYIHNIKYFTSVYMNISPTATGMDVRDSGVFAVFAVFLVTACDAFIY
jgi:hypothetical protein